MDKRKCVAILFAAVLTMGGGTGHAAWETLLYNPNQTRMAVAFLDQDTAPWRCHSYSTHLWEGHLDGNPGGQWGGCYNGSQWLNTPDGSRPTFFHATYGWTNDRLNQYPGFTNWWLSGGQGAPAEFRYRNLSLNVASIGKDPCVGYEVGMLQHTFGGESYSFRPNKTLGMYNGVVGWVTAKEVSFSGPIQCTAYPSAGVNADFLVEYRDAYGALVRWDLLGVMIKDHSDWNPPGPVFWTDGCTMGPYCRKILQGAEIGVAQLDGNYKTIAIDFKALLAGPNGFPPPPGFTHDQAIVTGFHVYSSMRGADHEFDVRGVDVMGF